MGVAEGLPAFLTWARERPIFYAHTRHAPLTHPPPPPPPLGRGGWGVAGPRPFHFPPPRPPAAGGP